MTQQETAALLRCELFDSIGEADALRLLQCCGAEIVCYDRGAVLWHSGSSVERCAVVLSGALRAETVSIGGRRSLAAYHGSGALVGDILMATPGMPSPVYVVAAERSAVLLLPYRQVMAGCSRCCDAHRQLRENLVAQIAKKFWAQRRRLGYLAIPTLRGRIASFLMDVRTGSGAFSLGLNREDMAAYLGANRSALSRELSRMKAEGLLDYYRDTFRITDEAKIKALL